MSDFKTILINEMNLQGIRDNVVRAGIAAVVGGETGFKPRTEDSYANTSVSRIRAVFGNRVNHLTDSQLEAMKKDDRAFFNQIYGGSWGSDNLGNTQPGDGFLFRGRGPNQLTGRSNYVRYARLSKHPELVTDPDLVNDPEVGAAVAVAYFVDRYKGGGWEGLKRAQGGNVGGEKDRLFQQYLSSGEFNYSPGASPGTSPSPSPASPASNNEANAAWEVFKTASRGLQTELAKLGFYNPPLKVDGIWGRGSEAALQAWLTDREENP